MADARKAGGAGARRARRPQRETMLGAALALAFLLAAMGTYFLWHISDRVGNLERGGGTSSSQSQAPPLPPPAKGSARALANEFDRTTRRLSGSLGSVRETLVSAHLERLGPALQQLQQNTSLFPQAVASINRLVAQTRGLSGLGGGVMTLGGQLGVLTAAVPGLTAQVSLTGGALRAANGTLAGLQQGINGTNTRLDRLARILQAATRSLDETRKSINKTNQCLETPVLCGVSPSTRSRAAPSNPSYSYPQQSNPGQRGSQQPHPDQSHASPSHPASPAYPEQPHPAKPSRKRSSHRGFPSQLTLPGLPFPNLSIPFGR